MGKNILYFVAALIVLALVGGVIVFFVQQRTPDVEVQPTIEQEQAQQEEGLGSELNQNPASKVPESNPLEGYRNPFE